MSEEQFSSAKSQHRAPCSPRRLKVPASGLGDVSEQKKVAVQECDDTGRRKEAEDELNFLPAQRSEPGPRSSLHAKKAEGIEDEVLLRLEEHDSRAEERGKEDPCLVPSMDLHKVVEAYDYHIAPKSLGEDEGRTRMATEPGAEEKGDRSQKKKGKEATKHQAPAVPEAYMAFGMEGESQRLVPSVVSLERPEKQAVKGKEMATGKEEPELLTGRDAPDMLQLKFDVSFVDDHARIEFAERQAAKLAEMLGLPPELVKVKAVVPG
eukprot:763656-Hanusia_phi.AAC.1